MVRSLCIRVITTAEIIVRSLERFVGGVPTVEKEIPLVPVVIRMYYSYTSNTSDEYFSSEIPALTANRSAL